MSQENEDELSYYLSQLYENLNIISQQLDIDNDQTITADNLDEDVFRLFENKFSEWMVSFYNILIYLFCTTIAFLAAVINPEVRFIAILMFFFFPFYLWFTFLYSIPEIVLNETVIFSRKDLTIRKQIKLAKSLFNFFLRQLYANAKIGIIIMIGYMMFLAIVIFDTYGSMLF